MPAMLLGSPAQVYVNDPLLWDPSPGNQKGKQNLDGFRHNAIVMMVFILSFIWKQNMNFLPSIHITAVAFLLSKTNCNNMSRKLRPKIQICCVVLFKKELTDILWILLKGVFVFTRKLFVQPEQNQMKHCTQEMTSAPGHAENDNGPFTNLTQCPNLPTAWQYSSGRNPAEPVVMPHCPN